MAYRWKPSKSQRKAFAQNMQNEQFAADYYARKQAREDKRRTGSQFDYNSAGGFYVPTKEQHDFCLHNWPNGTTSAQDNARNMVLSGYTCNEKVHHDYIHIVNELRRSL